MDIDKFRRWMQSQLRRMWRAYPERELAKVKARVSHGRYECAMCGETDFTRHDIHVDHINPVIDPTCGFQGWDEYIGRMFVPHTDLRILCKPCHKTVTAEQNKIRREFKKKNKKI